MRFKGFILNLSLVITLLGVVACNEQEDGVTAVTGPDGVEIVDTTPAKPGSPSAPAPGGSEPGKGPEKPVEKPVVVDPAADALAKAQEEYAKYTGASLDDVKKHWEENLKGVQVTANALTVNTFLNFVHKVDPEVRSQLEYAKIQNENAHRYAIAKNFTQLNFSLGYLALNNGDIKLRILEAARIFGVPFRDFRATEEPMSGKLNDAMGSFTFTTIASIGEDGELRNKLNQLLTSVTFVYSKYDGTGEAILSFENFSGIAALIFPFVDSEGNKQGGYGIVDPLSVVF